MAEKKLGKGFSNLGLTELLSGLNKSTTNNQTSALTSLHSIQSSELQKLALEKLVPGQFQPRQQFDEASLMELAHSIKSQGMIQPIIVRPLLTGSSPSQQFEIIAGERRWRAAQLALLKEVPVIIKKISDQDAIAVALIENIQRRDLNVLEEAIALQRLLNEFQLTHQKVATLIGKSRTHISNLLRLLNLSSDVKALLADSKLEMGHARALLSLENTLQATAAHNIIAKQLSVRATEDYVRQLLSPPSQSGRNQPLSSSSLSSLNANDTELMALQKQLIEKLKTKVMIKQQASGKGRLIIHYKDWNKLNHILKNWSDNIP